MADKQLNMRISDETRAMFDELVKSSGMTQAEYFASLLQGAKTDEIKALVPDSVDEIDEFDAKLNGIREIYMGAIRRAADAYEVASSRVKGQMDQLGALVEENRRLKGLEAENKRLTEELAKAQAVAAEVEELKRQLTEAREQLVTLREQHADAVEQQRKEHNDELIASIMRVMQEHTKG